jgi:hypothetical protein
MAITINQADNTISGISVGGLPDGCIDSDCFSDGTIQESDCVAGLVSGTICNAATFYDSTKTTISFPSGSTMSPASYMSVTYTKTRADTDLHITAVLNVYGGGGSGANGMELTLTKGSSSHTTPSATGSIVHGSGYTPYANLSTCSWVVDSANCNEAGDWTITEQVHPYADVANNNPFTVINPDSSNDSRLEQRSSCLMVFEYLPTT